jgi:hypothetical protein
MLVGQRSPKVYTSSQNDEPKPLPAPKTTKEVDNRIYQGRMIREQGKAEADEIRKQGKAEADEIRRQGKTEADEIRRQGFDEAAQHGQKAQEGLKKADEGQRKADEADKGIKECDKDLNRMEAIRAKALAEKQRRQQLANNEAPQSQSSQRRGT